MKGFLRSCIAGMLAILARAILNKYKPTVVMVTGSVGKTSTKDAVAAALSEHTYVRASEKSYNSEFGVPLTIIGSKNPWTNFSRWTVVIQEALALIFLPSHYPKLLVLEVGADSPGDLAKILRFATPDAVVVTRLPDVPVHVEAYASTQAVKDEEFTPAYALAPGAPLILASNNDYALTMGKKTLAKIVTFGFADSAVVRISEPRVRVEKGRAVGMEADVTIDGKTTPLFVQGALGRHQLLAPAAALATAHSLSIPLKEAFTGLSRYLPPSGRSRLLEGLQESVVIDDSYNSSPAAVEEALASLAMLPISGKKIAVLGDMLELGRYSVSEHDRVGTQAAKCADILVTVGSRSEGTQLAAIAAGLPETSTHHFATAREAVNGVRALLHVGDAMLIKGSQGMRMERIVEEVLANPEDKSYLVRQEKEWKRR